MTTGGREAVDHRSGSRSADPRSAARPSTSRSPFRARAPGDRRIILSSSDLETIEVTFHG